MTDINLLSSRYRIAEWSARVIAAGLVRKEEGMIQKVDVCHGKQKVRTAHEKIKRCAVTIVIGYMLIRKMALYWER